MRNGLWILVGLTLPLLPACKSSFEPTELTGFPAAAGTPPPANRPPANNSGSSGIKMKGGTAAAPAAAAPASGNTPTPEQVCNSMIRIVEQDGGSMDATVRRQAMDLCLEQMRPEKVARGAEWTPLANCIIAARNDADIDECDRRFPKDSSASTGGIKMKGGAAPSGTGSDSVSDEELVAFLKSLFLTGSELPAGLESTVEPTLQVDEEKGYIIGAAIWLNPKNDTKISSFLDVRYIFTSEQEAQSWLSSNVASLTEGYPAISSAPKVGQDCRVHGGTKDGVTSYIYVFRVGQVVMQMFVSQGSGAGNLSAKDVSTYAQKAASRLQP